MIDKKYQKNLQKEKLMIQLKQIRTKKFILTTKVYAAHTNELYQKKKKTDIV